jgi:hypothetical protein
MQMKTAKLAVTVVVIIIAIAGFTSCRKSSTTSTHPLRGCSGYTPYDAFTMLWARGSDDRTMVWVNSGSDAGRLLTSRAEEDKRPDFAVCTQGVVAGLAARGEDIVIIASVYVSDSAIRPVFRKPKSQLVGLRSLFIPKSSIEFAFENLLTREGATRSDIRIPKVEKTDFTTITSLLRKPVGENDALDFAILVEPFISNLMTEQPGAFEIGPGGIYEMHYSVCVRRADLIARRADFVRLLSEFNEVDKEIQAINTDSEFLEKVWGRMKDGKPETLPALMTFSRAPLRLQLQTGTLRQRLQNELAFLVSRYPNDLRMPVNVDQLVDPSLLREISPSSVAE